MKVKLEISFRELDDLEDLITAWNLCNKHNAVFGISEDVRWKFTQTCPNCKRINKEIRNKSLRLWSKLMTAYLKSNGNHIRNSKRRL